MVGVLGSADSPWTEPALEVAASLLAGNGVVLAPAAPLAGERLRAALLRAGIPGELLAVVHGDAARAALPDACARVVSLEGPATKGALLVLEGAPVEQVASAALWAAFAAGGRHPAAAGRLVCVPSVAEPLLGLLRERALRLERRRPRERAGGGRSAALSRGPRGARGARRGGGLRRGGADLRRPGQRRGTVRPVLRARRAAARARRRADPARARTGPGAGGRRGRRARPPRSSWCRTGPRRATAAPAAASSASGPRDRAKGERVARTLEAELTWVNEHGAVAPGPALRLQRHVAARQVASRTAVIGGARRLPYDPGLVRARTAVTRLVHGREADRLTVLRRDAGPLARAALRVGSGLLRRR